MLIAALILPATAAGGAPTVPTMRGGMNGSQEVPGPGDPDGSGNYKLTFPSATQVCWVVRHRDIDAPTLAHIHAAARGVSGPPVIDIPVSTLAGGCSGTGDAADVQAIRANPSQYYVNVHTGPFPGGAIRGQLHRVGGL